MFPSITIDDEVERGLGEGVNVSGISITVTVYIILGLETADVCSPLIVMLKLYV